MRPANYLPDPSILVTSFVSLILFSAPVFGQQGGGGGNDDGDDAAEPPIDDVPTETVAPPESTAEPESSSESSESSESTSVEAETTSVPEETSSSTETFPELSTSTSASNVIITGPAGTDTAAGPTGFPSLTKNPAAPEYPAATVPPTNHAPFMQQSNLPDGTVFIAVGAILGAFGLGILLWSLITRMLLHRSVERASKAQHDETSKAGFPAPPAPFYKYTDQGSTMSLSAAGRGVRRTNRGTTPSANPSVSNLFFSPTAAGSNTAGNRSSTFLPSGFYAAGNSSAGPNHQPSISLTNLRPDSRGHYGNASRGNLNPSPPDSPRFAARRDMSSSSLNLNVVSPAGQRAPSAYLEDLLADDPSSFPPPHMPSAGGPPRPSSRNL